MSNLTIKIQAQGDAVIVNLIGAADMTEAQELDKSMQKLCAVGTKHIIIAMNSLNFACSMALGSLVKLRQKCHQERIHLSLAGIQPILLKVLQTTQLDNLFDIYDSIEHAIGGISPEEINE